MFVSLGLKLLCVSVNFHCSIIHLPVLQVGMLPLQNSYSTIDFVTKLHPSQKKNMTGIYVFMKSKVYIVYRKACMISLLV